VRRTQLAFICNSWREEAAFLAFERRLIEVAGSLAHGWAVYCFRILSRGIVEFYFYSRDESVLGALAEEFSREYPEYRIEEETFPDATWSEYRKYLATVS
jgi:hypothetical protein